MVRDTVGKFLSKFLFLFVTYIRDSGEESIVSLNVVFAASFSAGTPLYFSNDVSPNCYVTQEQQAWNNKEFFFCI